MTAQVLSTRQLNRTLLARQLLLERVDLTIPAALDRLCGIQNQYAPNAYIRLWSCLAGFRRDDLTAAYEAGACVQGTLMRATIHTVSAADYHPLVAAVREPLQAWARRVNGGASDDRRAEFVEVVRRTLSSRPPLARAAFLDLVAVAGPAVKQTIHTDAEVVRVPPSGTWHRRRADLFGLADDLIGEHVEVAPAEGRRHLVRRYLAAFGPAAARDIATFCGIPPAMLAPTLESLDLVSYSDESGTTLLDLPGAEIAPPDIPAPVRFLPTWDSILLVHARRTAVLSEQHRDYLFSSKTPHAFPTFMVDGAIAGTWRWDAAAGRIAIEPLERLPDSTMAELDAEAAGLAELHR